MLSGFSLSETETLSSWFLGYNNLLTLRLNIMNPLAFLLTPESEREEQIKAFVAIAREMMAEGNICFLMPKTESPGSSQKLYPYSISWAALQTLIQYKLTIEQASKILYPLLKSAKFKPVPDMTFDEASLKKELERMMNDISEHTIQAGCEFDPEHPNIVNARLLKTMGPEYFSAWEENEKFALAIARPVYIWADAEKFIPVPLSEPMITALRSPLNREVSIGEMLRKELAAGKPQDPIWQNWCLKLRIVFALHFLHETDLGKACLSIANATISVPEKPSLVQTIPGSVGHDEQEAYESMYGAPINFLEAASLLTFEGREKCRELIRELEVGKALYIVIDPKDKKPYFIEVNQSKIRTISDRDSLKQVIKDAVKTSTSFGTATKPSKEQKNKVLAIIDTEAWQEQSSAIDMAKPQFFDLIAWRNSFGLLNTQELERILPPDAAKEFIKQLENSPDLIYRNHYVLYLDSEHWIVLNIAPPAMKRLLSGQMTLHELQWVLEAVIDGHIKKNKDPSTKAMMKRLKAFLSDSTKEGWLYTQQQTSAAVALASPAPAPIGTEQTQEATAEPVSMLPPPHAGAGQEQETDAESIQELETKIVAAPTPPLPHTETEQTQEAVILDNPVSSTPVEIESTLPEDPIFSPEEEWHFAAWQYWTKCLEAAVTQCTFDINQLLIRTLERQSQEISALRREKTKLAWIERSIMQPLEDKGLTVFRTASAAVDLNENKMLVVVSGSGTQEEAMAQFLNVMRELKVTLLASEQDGFQFYEEVFSSADSRNYHNERVRIVYLVLGEKSEMNLTNLSRTADLNVDACYLTGRGEITITPPPAVIESILSSRIILLDPEDSLTKVKICRDMWLHRSGSYPTTDTQIAAYRQAEHVLQTTLFFMQQGWGIDSKVLEIYYAPLLDFAREGRLTPEVETMIQMIAQQMQKSIAFNLPPSPWRPGFDSTSMPTEEMSHPTQIGIGS